MQKKKKRKNSKRGKEFGQSFKVKMGLEPKCIFRLECFFSFSVQASIAYWRCRLTKGYTMFVMCACIFAPQGSVIALPVWRQTFCSGAEKAKPSYSPTLWNETWWKSNIDMLPKGQLSLNLAMKAIKSDSLWHFELTLWITQRLSSWR